MSDSIMREPWDARLKCPVIRNFDGNYDREDSEPVAVMLGWDRGRVVYAPCSIWTGGIKAIPHGSVLLTRQSPVYADTGFTAEKILISVRDAGSFSFDSARVKHAVQAGTLYPWKDKKLSKNLDRWLEIYNLTAVRECVTL